MRSKRSAIAHNDEMHIGSAKRNIASGVAGLNSRGYVVSTKGIVMDVGSDCFNQIEDFNIDSTTDIYTLAATGNGSVTITAASSIVTVDGGTTNATSSTIIRNGVTYTPSASPILFISRIQAVQIPVASNFVVMRLGLCADFTDGTTNTQGAFVAYDTVNGWYFRTRGATTGNNTTITALSANDVVEIVLTSTAAYCFVNGVQVAKHTTNIPNTALNFGAGVAIASATVSQRGIWTLDNLICRAPL